jgi:ariadne-1
MSDDEYSGGEDYVDEEERSEKSQMSESEEEDLDDTIGTQEPATKQQSYEVISESEMMKESKNLIDDVMEYLDIPNRAIAACLLRTFSWNRERLIEAYMEDSAAVCAKAGVPSLDLEKPPDNPEAISECLVCMDDFKNSDSFALPCGHRYCRTCWQNYLEVKINDGAECITATCMAPKCKSVVHEEAYKKIVSPKLFEQYSKFLLRSFVDDNPKVKWCPAPNCSHCVRCERQGRKEAVQCGCGFRFCFKCCDYEIGDHMPADCDSVEAWRQKAADESENVTWMIANTKKCPQCRSPIEKNGGCMHMTCRKGSGGCGFEFCWLCRGPWSEHGSHTGGYYNCNKYDSSTAKDEDTKAADAKTELEHYMFYYHRYESHRNAMKIADEQRKNADKKGNAIMAKFDVRAADTKFLMEATEQLLNNRRVLQWSYVYGFYLSDPTKSAEKNLFEYLQEDLEKHTNYLSELYERPADKISEYQSFIQWKEEVTNYTRVCSKFLQNFVVGVMGGLTVQDKY